MRLLLAGNMTLAPLKRHLKDHEVTTLDFADFRPLLTGARDAALGATQGILLVCDGVELAFEAGFDSGRVAALIDEYAAGVAGLARRNPGVFVLATNTRLPADWPASFSEAIATNGPAALEWRLHDALARASAELPNLILVDLARAVGTVGEANAYASGMRYFGRFGFSPTLTKALAAHLTRLINAVELKSKKVIAVDFDNTLWGGVVGDLGSRGVTLSEDGVGRAYRHFQIALKAAAARGVVLVGLTKNNAADVEAVFAENDMMVLERKDFTLLYANWEPKALNVAKAAETLNLGLDSFVFIDDNPVEREGMQKMRPEVNVADFPAQADALPGWFLSEVIPAYFPAYRLTREDLDKTQQYRNNAERAQLKDTLTHAEYIDSLGIDLEFLINDARDVVRLAQMSQKTNQFNLTTRRYTTPEMEQMIAGPQHDVVAMRYSDKFGKEGIVGLAILNGDASEVDTFLMSCRVIGRGVEERLMGELERLARERGKEQLHARFIPTAKNAVSEGFLENAGFAATGADGRRSKDI